MKSRVSFSPIFYAILFISIIILFNCCVARVQQAIVKPSTQMRDYNNIVIYYVDEKGGIFDARDVPVGSPSIHRSIFEYFVQELLNIGFNRVFEENRADAIVYFRVIARVARDYGISAIRDYDTQNVVTKVSVEFRDRKNSKTLASFYKKRSMSWKEAREFISNSCKMIKSKY